MPVVSSSAWFILLTVVAVFTLGGCADDEPNALWIGDVLANPDKFVGDRIRVEDARVISTMYERDFVLIGVTRSGCLEEDGSFDWGREGCEWVDNTIAVSLTDDADVQEGDRITVDGEFHIVTEGGANLFVLTKAVLVDVR